MTFSELTVTPCSSWASRENWRGPYMLSDQTCQWNWGPEVQSNKIDDTKTIVIFILTVCISSPSFPLISEERSLLIYKERDSELGPIPSPSGRNLISLINTWYILILRFLAKWKPGMDWNLVEYGYVCVLVCVHGCMCACVCGGGGGGLRTPSFDRNTE